MDAVLQGLSGIFEVVLIAGLGFFLSRTGWLWETAGKDLTRLTMTVALPPFMIYSLKSNFTRQGLIETAPDLLLPFASISLPMWPAACGQPSSMCLRSTGASSPAPAA